MKKKYYYLHVWAIIGFDSDTKFDEQAKSAYNLGLLIDSPTKDDLFCVGGNTYFVTEALKLKIEASLLSGVAFDKVSRIRKGCNLADQNPTLELPPHYWNIKCSDMSGLNDFAQWDRTYMIVSEVALDILRSNNVVHAEADEITVPLAEYFDSPRKYFWMKEERMRQYFVDMDERKKKQRLERGGLDA
jgi:hypothetical protein